MCFDCLSTPEEQAQKGKSNDIDKLLVADRKVDEKIVKLLLLGSGESGKSTFIKQLRIIKGSGFNETNRADFVLVIRSNLLQATKSILSAMAILYIEFETQEAKAESQKVLQLLNEEANNANPDYDESIDVSPTKLAAISNSIVTMWKDEGFKQCFNRSKEYQLMDSAEYYLDKAAAICDPSFHPSDQDILRSRKKTTNINEYMFDIKRVQLKVIDVGGQRKERRKWISCFDNVTSIIFLASLSDYDLRLQESQTTNRMRESLDLFATILQYPWFKKKSIILFLNKTDLFEKKIPHSNIADYFPEYKGPHRDAESAKAFIKALYEEKKPPPHEGPDATHIFPHFTCATDTDNITKVFKDVQEIILRSYLNEFNLV